MLFRSPLKPKLEITKGEKLYLVFNKYGTTGNTFNVDYKTATGTYFDSPTGTTWTSRTGAPAYRIYSAARLTTTVENTRIKRLLTEPRERTFPIRADLEEQTVRQTMIAVSELMGKQIRKFDRVLVSPVTDRIPLNKFCYLEDGKTGLFTRTTVENIDISITPNESGAQQIELGLTSLR